MRRLFVLAAALVFVGAGAMQARAAETWKGTIGDSMCGVKHSADKHGDKAGDHRACVEKCIAGGGEYVFITDGKALKIANQSFEGLKAHAAHEVMLTGELKDGAIVVSKIEMPKAEKK
ncbi:MAG TPA: hypothetical protein VJ813_16595 [Vicinamibacterales bacterium]|nr:hypothetical protein [Vicinamibacterales bacterium]